MFDEALRFREASVSNPTSVDDAAEAAKTGVARIPWDTLGTDGRRTLRGDPAAVTVSGVIQVAATICTFVDAVTREQEEVRMKAKEWIAAYAERLDTAPPTSSELKLILDLASEAAHGSERIAAPVACWLSARAGRSLEESLEVARSLKQAHEP